MSLRLAGGAALPPGPRRDLTVAMYKLYERAGGIAVSGRTIAKWVEADSMCPSTVSHTTVGHIICGTGSLPSQAKVESVAMVLLKRSGTDSNIATSLERLRRLWVASQNPDTPIALIPEQNDQKFSLYPDECASHFAELGFDWGSAVEGRQPGYLQGCIALARRSDDGTSLFPQVFSKSFQADLEQLQEWNILRQHHHWFDTKVTRTRSSFIVHGALLPNSKGGPSSGYVAVEAHSIGAVTVYFRENVRSWGVDELFGWWVLGALQIAIHAHGLLNSGGAADVALTADTEGAVDYSPSGIDLASPRDAPVRLFRGPGHSDLYYFAQRAAVERTAKLRSGVVRSDPGGDDWDVNPVWRWMLAGRRKEGMIFRDQADDVV